MKNRNLWRVLSLVMVLAMLFAIVACTGGNGDTTSTTAGTSAQATTAKKTTAQKTTAKATTAATTAKGDDPVVPPADPTIYSGTPDVSWYDASKTEFVLTTADQFRGFLELRSTSKDYTFEGMTIKLDTDVVINTGTPEEIFAAGGPNECPVFNSGWQFKGIFDGQGHTVTGTYQKATGSCVRGLFGAMGENAVIKNLTIKNHVFGGPTADKNTYGVITPRISGTNVLFSNITVVDALLKRDSNKLDTIGGLAGRLDADTSLTIENCSTSGVINFEDGTQVGGLVGLVNAGATLTIKNSTSAMNITCADIAGGLVGEVADGATVTANAGCNYTGTITITGTVKGDIIGTGAADVYYADATNHWKLDATGAKVEETAHTWSKVAEEIPWCTTCGYKRNNISSYEGAVTELAEHTPYYILSGVTLKKGAGTPYGTYSVQYVNGTVSSNKLKATSDKAEAQAYMLEKVADTNDRYYIYYMDGETKTYLVWGTGSGTSQINVTTTVSEKCVWYINAAEMLIYAEGETQRYLGCFETADFRAYSPTNFGAYGVGTTVDGEGGWEAGYYTAWFVPAT